MIKHFDYSGGIDIYATKDGKKTNLKTVASNATYVSGVINRHHIFFPTGNGKVHDERHAFFCKQYEDGSFYVGEESRVITATTLKDSPGIVRYVAGSKAPFVQIYEFAPDKRAMEEKCIAVYTKPMVKDEHIESFLNIAEKEGWVLQYIEASRMIVGGGKNMLWKFLFSDKDRVASTAKDISPAIHRAWNEVTGAKRMARSSMFLNSYFRLAVPRWLYGSKAYTLPFDTNGASYIIDDILRLSGIMDNVIKQGLIGKSIVYGASREDIFEILRGRATDALSQVLIDILLTTGDERMSHIAKANEIRSFLRKRKLPKAPFFMGSEEQKLKDLTLKEVVDNLAENPVHRPANKCKDSVTLRLDPKCIEDEDIKVDFSEPEGLLEKERWSKYSVVKWLGRLDKEGKLCLDGDLRLLYLNMPLGMVTKQKFWEHFTAKIKRLLFTQYNGFTGTLGDKRDCPRSAWENGEIEVHDVILRLPPALQNIKCRVWIWRSEGIIFVDSYIIINFDRDTDGDLAQVIFLKNGIIPFKVYIEHPEEYYQVMPIEPETGDTRTQQEVIIKQLRSLDPTGIIHNLHLAFLGMAETLGLDRYDLMRSSREETEQWIMLAKYFIETNQTPSLTYLMDKFGLEWDRGQSSKNGKQMYTDTFWSIIKSQSWESKLKNSTLDIIINTLKDSRKIGSDWWSSTALNFLGWNSKLKGTVQRPRDIDTSIELTDEEQTLVKLETLRVDSFKWLINETQHEYLKCNKCGNGVHLYLNKGRYVAWCDSCRRTVWNKFTNTEPRFKPINFILDSEWDTFGSVWNAENREDIKLNNQFWFAKRLDYVFDHIDSLDLPVNKYRACELFLIVLGLCGSGKNKKNNEFSFFNTVWERYLTKEETKSDLQSIIDGNKELFEPID